MSRRYIELTAKLDPYAVNLCFERGVKSAAKWWLGQRVGFFDEDQMRATVPNAGLIMVNLPQRESAPDLENTALAGGVTLQIRCYRNQDGGTDVALGYFATLTKIGFATNYMRSVAGAILDQDPAATVPPEFRP